MSRSTRTSPPPARPRESVPPGPGPGAPPPTSLLAAALALVLWAAPAAAQEAGGAAEAGTTVSGHVVRADGAGPVRGATVRLPSVGMSAVTRPDGAFLLEGVPPGRHELVVERIGLSTARRTVEVAGEPVLGLEIAVSEEAVQQEGLVVTASRTSAAVDEISASVSVLSEEQVRTNPARTSDDLLRTATSVNLPRASSSTTHPTGQSVSIRGTGRNRTLVLLDGIPMNDAFGGWIRWGLAPKEFVDRVEVVRGGGSSLFGTYAMGGVIQLFTKRPEGDHLAVRSGLGERSLREVQVHGAHVTGDWAVSVLGNVESGGGFVDEVPSDRGPVDVASSSARRNLTVRAEVTPDDDDRFYAMGSYFDEDRDNGTPLQTNSRRIGTAALGAEMGAPETGQWKANLFGSVHRFENANSRTFDGRASEALSRSQQVPVEDVGASLQWTRSAGPFEAITLGADARYINGENQETAFDAEGDVDTQFRAGGRQLLAGAFLETVLSPSDRWRVEGSVRLDTWSNFDAFRDVEGGADQDLPSRDDQEASARLGTHFRAADGLAFRAAGYRTFRAPTLNELYRGFFASNLAFDPNARLGPETLVGGEAGVDLYLVPGLTVKSTAFWNQIEDRIDFVFQGSSGGVGRLQRENIGKTRLRGVETEASLRLGERLSVSANYTFIDSDVLGSASAEDIGNEAPEVPQDQASVQATWDGRVLGRFGVVARYVGQEFEDDANTVPLDDHFVVDVRGSRTVVPGVRAFLAAENLFDAFVQVTGRNGITRRGLPQTLRAGVEAELF